MSVFIIIINFILALLINFCFKKQLLKLLCLLKYGNIFLSFRFPNLSLEIATCRDSCQCCDLNHFSKSTPILNPSTGFLQTNLGFSFQKKLEVSSRKQFYCLMGNKASKIKFSPGFGGSVLDASHSI